LQAKLGNYLVAWDDSFTSHASEKVLVISIAQALLAYVICVFKLSNGICDELMKIIRRYYWGAAEGKRKTHWLAWDNPMKSKDHGGVVFKDFCLFNQALLARKDWR
jgi:hypothetical protein